MKSHIVAKTVKSEKEMTTPEMFDKVVSFCLYSKIVPKRISMKIMT